MIDPARRIRPPGGVRFAGWMIGIGAFFTAVSGLLLLFLRPDRTTLDEVGITQGILQVIGFILLTIGLLEFLLIYALWDGSNVARIIATVLEGLVTLGALPRALAGGPGALASLFQLVIAFAVLLGLWGTPNATEFFRRPEAPIVPLPIPPTPPPPV